MPSRFAARLLVIGFIAIAFISRIGGAEPTTAPSTKSTTSVKRGSLKLNVSAAGAFEPVDPFEVRLRFKAYQGDLYIVFAAPQGGEIAKGDTILQLDDTQIKRQLASAQSGRDTAKANFDKAQSDMKLGEEADALALKMQQDELKNAENGLKWWEDVDGKQMLKNADLSVKRAKDSVEDQQDELDQLKKMYKSEELTNATADIVVKRAIRNLEQSKIGLQMTEDRSRKTKEHEYEIYHSRVQYGVDQQRQALERLQAQQQQAKVQRQDGLTNARLGLEAAEERLANLKSDYEQFAIKAPQSMTVFHGQLVNGSWQHNDPRLLRAGERLFLGRGDQPPIVQMTGFLPGKFCFTADVPEDNVLLIAKGQKVTVTGTAMPQKPIDGTVTDVVRAVVSGSGGYDVGIDLSGDSSWLLPGMKGTAKFDVPAIENVLIVPTGAVRSGKVWMSSGGEEKSVDVVTGRSDGESIEIVSGLKEGDEILSQAKK